MALQLGHRISVDLDFFSSQDFDAELLSNRLKRIGDLVIEQQGQGNLIGYLSKTHVSFFFYDYPLLTPTITFEGVRLASIEEIGVMKLIAIGQRGRPRDSIDLFFIIRHGFSFEHLLAQAFGKVSDDFLSVLSFAASAGLLRRRRKGSDAEDVEARRMGNNSRFLFLRGESATSVSLTVSIGGGTRERQVRLAARLQF